MDKIKAIIDTITGRAQQNAQEADQYYKALQVRQGIASGQFNTSPTQVNTTYSGHDMTPSSFAYNYGQMGNLRDMRVGGSINQNQGPPKAGPFYNGVNMGAVQKPQMVQNFMQKLPSTGGGAVMGSNTQATPSPTPTPVPDQYNFTPQEQKIVKAIQQGTQTYKGLPVATLAAQIVANQRKYPIFQKYPFLAVAQSILESSGLNAFKTKPDIVNKPKQALGWGIYAKDYNPGTVEQVFKDYISGIGGRTPQEGFTPEQIQTSQSYNKFRQTGNLQDLANTYAPTSDNPKYGGSVYANNLANVMSDYNNTLQKL